MKQIVQLVILLFIIGCSPYEGARQPTKPKIVTPKLTPACEISETDSNVDMTCIENHLKTKGLGGWVHASVKDQQMLVFTWRRPGNFFINIQLPMSSKDPVILKKLLGLKRHDQIILKGEFFKNEAPLKHVNVTELTVVKLYDGPVEKYKYDADLPAEVLENTTMVAKVHIVANGGAVLVVELGDRVYPVFNTKPSLVAGLYRNDKIELKYTVRISPQRPPHLEVNTKADLPVRVIEEIAQGHGQPITLTGPLVMFPESPQIKFNVFALRTEDADGINRNYTILNFEDFDLFMAIKDKLQAAWTKAEAHAEYDRNKYINRKVILTVEGTKNLVSPQQANPQVVPMKIEDVKIKFLE